eukprot:1193300-Prorocentrum_minimum.AAC.6
MGNILSLCHSIGHPWGIFSVSVILLVTHGEYSQSVAFYWPPAGNTLFRTLQRRTGGRARHGHCRIDH